MSAKWSKAFWFDLLERVGSVFVYGLITWFSVTEALDFDWTTLWPVVVLPTILSALKCLSANLKNPASGASLLNPPPQVIDVVGKHEGPPPRDVQI